MSSLVFTSCNCFIAFRPNGVAALSKPSMLAEKFISIEPEAGWFFGSSGNNLLKNGPTNLERIFIAPPASPIFIIPNHKVIAPIKPMQMVTLTLLISKVL